MAAESAAADGVRVQADGPGSPVIADWSFAVTTSWSTDVPRALFVLLLRSPSCGRSAREGLELDRHGFTVVGGEQVSGSGRRDDEVTITTVGEYLDCGYLQPSNDPSLPADAVLASPHRLRASRWTAARLTRAGVRRELPGGSVAGSAVERGAPTATARRFGLRVPSPRPCGDMCCLRPQGDLPDTTSAAAQPRLERRHPGGQ